MSLSGVLKRLPAYIQDPVNRVLASSLGRRLALGAFWSMLGTTLSKLCSTVSWVVVGRLLGKEEFGQLNMVQSIVGLLGAAAGLGMGIAAARYVAEYKKSDPQRAGRFIAFASAATWITSILFTILLAGLSSWLARETLSIPQLEEALLLSALMLLFSGVTGAQQGTLIGLESFKAIAAIHIVVGITSFPIMLTGALWGGLHGALWALITSAALNCLLNAHAIRKEAARSRLVITYRGCFQESPVFWNCNLPSMANTVLNACVSWATSALLVRQAGQFGELGLYNAVYRMKLIPENIAAMLLAPVLPILSDTFTRGDLDSYRKTLSVSFSVATIIIVPLALIQISAPWLTLLPYGPEFAVGQSIVPWMMLSTIAYALSWPMGNILIITGRIWFALAVGTFHNVVSLLLAWWLIPVYGAAGLAFGVTLSFILAHIPTVWVIRKAVPDMLHQAQWLKMAFLSLGLALLCVAAFRWLEPASALTVGLAAGGVYFIWRTHTHFKVSPSPV